MKLYAKLRATSDFVNCIGLYCIALIAKAYYVWIPIHNGLYPRETPLNISDWDSRLPPEKDTCLGLETLPHFSLLDGLLFCLH